MTFFMIFVFALGGAFLAGAMSEHGLTGLLFGGLVGWLFSRSVQSTRRIEALQQELHEANQRLTQIESQRAAGVVSANIQDAPASTTASAAASPTDQQTDSVTKDEDAAPASMAAASTTLVEASASPTSATEPSSAPEDRWLAAGKRPMSMPPLPNGARPPPPIPAAAQAQTLAQASTQVHAQAGAEARTHADAHTRESVASTAYAEMRANEAQAGAGILRMAQADSVFDRLKAFFTEGNLPAKFGVLVLFFGVAALLKYAADQGWFTFPIEWRLSGIAAAAIGALVFAFTKRDSNRGFSLAVQGGAIGILMLTVFAAFRYYHLLPQTLTFGLMVLLAVTCGILAVKQNAFALALIGLLGGFLAPILVSTGGGSHVVLFSYYLILNLVIFGIAWVREWRVLNLLGWFFTFGIGVAWGVLRYRPEHFNSTEPFLIAFTVLFTAIAFVYAWRAPGARRGFVDGTLTFGTPLVAFLLQAGLLEGERMPLAWSALVVAAFYLVMAFFAHSKAGLRNLRDSYAGLAVVFGTVAVPLALSARATAATWAVEGALLIWLGLRQDHRVQRWAGWLLLLGASIAFLFGYPNHVPMHDDTPFLLNGDWFGALILAASFGFAARCYRRARATDALVTILFFGAVFWWLSGSFYEVQWRLPWPEAKAEALLILFSITGALCALLAKRWQFAVPAWTASVVLLLGIPFAYALDFDRGHPFGGYAAWGWIAFAAASVWILAQLRERIGALRIGIHAFWWLVWPLIASLEILWWIKDGGYGSAWRLLALAAPWLLLMGAIVGRARWLAAPNLDDAPSLHTVLGVMLATVLSMGLLYSVFQRGDASPLSFLPVLNPLELAQVATVVVLFWFVRQRIEHPDSARSLRYLMLGLGFVLYSVAVLRGVHHLAELPWNSALIAQKTAQSALTIAWSAIGIVVMLVASRRANRALWYAGWGLMLVVLAKLLLIDRRFIGDMPGIISFLGVGLLLVAVGYFAPAPAKAVEPGERA